MLPFSSTLRKLPVGLADEVCLNRSRHFSCFARGLLVQDAFMRARKVSRECPVRIWNLPAGSSEPADIAGVIDPADGSAEGPVKAGGSPTFRRNRLNHSRNSAAAKGEFHLWLLVVEGMITAPGSLKIRLFDCRAEFCNEPLHRDHPFDRGLKRELHEETIEDLGASPQTITEFRNPTDILGLDQNMVVGAATGRVSLMIGRCF